MATFIFIIVLTLASSAAKIMHVLEGDEVELHFSYPCNSTRITLQYGYRAPCFSSNPWSKSMPPNQELEIENKTDDCCIKLTISPVSKDDAGTYILTAYRNGFMLPEYPRIGLRVAFPPRKASCEINDNLDDNAKWLSLHCRAPQGTLPGQIVCYQNETKLPNMNGPRESNGHLRQELLARLDGFVRCCSSTIDHIKEERNCTDWGWDPMSGRIFEDISPLASEAGSTEHTNHLTSVHTVTANITTTTPDIVESFLNRETEPVEYLESRTSNLHWKVSFSLSMSISVIIIIILSIVYILKVKEMERLKSSLPTINAAQPGNTCLQSPNKYPDESNV